MSESRFLLSFCALLASVILVSLTLLLLQASTDWDHKLAEATPHAAPVAAPAAKAEPSTPRDIAPPVATASLPADAGDDTETQQDSGELPASDQTELPFPVIDTVSETGAVLAAHDETPDESDPVAAESNAVRVDPDVAASATVDDIGEASAAPDDLLAETEAPVVASGAILAAPDVEATPANDAIAALLALAEIAPAPSADAPLSEGGVGEPTPQLVKAEKPDKTIVASAEEDPPLPQRAPRPAPPAAEPAAIAQPEEPAADGSAGASAANEIPVPSRQDSLPEIKIAQPKAAAKPAPRSDPPKIASAKVASVQDSPRWKPMALAPNEKPAVATPKTKPLGGGAYRTKLWAALARHKPKAGQSGSATVTFAIGPSGALRSVRIARSSGNARIDQLALATVRNAAPFPEPPAAATYTIRIEFH